MQKINLGLWGEVEVASGDYVYFGEEINVNGEIKEVDLYIDEFFFEQNSSFDFGKILSQNAMNTMDKVVRENFSLENKLISDFVNEHFVEIPEKMQEMGIANAETFLAKIKLKKVNMFGVNEFDGGEPKIAFDYSINPDISDELLVAYFDLDGKFLNFSHES